MSKILSILECILLIAIALPFSMQEIMAAGTTPVAQPTGSFSGVTPSVGQTNALFSGVLPTVGINQGMGLFSGQLPTPTALGSSNAKGTIIQLGQTQPSVSIITNELNTPAEVNNPLNHTVPLVVAEPLNKTEPEVVTPPLNTTQALNTTMS